MFFFFGLIIHNACDQNFINGEAMPPIEYDAQLRKTLYEGHDLNWEILTLSAKSTYEEEIMLVKESNL